MLFVTEYTCSYFSYFFFSCSILMWPFFWLCILSFLCIKFIVLSQKRVLSLFETSKNDFKILRSTRVFFSFYFILFYFILFYFILIKPIDKIYLKYQSHLVFLYIISYWLIRILLFLILKFLYFLVDVIVIFIFNFLNCLNLWLLKGLRET